MCKFCSLFLCLCINFRKKNQLACNCIAVKGPGDACGEDEWQCDNHQCINAEFLCDGTNDCTDNSDEGHVCSTGKVLSNPNTHKKQYSSKVRY